jgi:hypothetical protein
MRIGVLPRLPLPIDAVAAVVGKTAEQGGRVHPANACAENSKNPAAMITRQDRRYAIFLFQINIFLNLD